MFETSVRIDCGGRVLVLDRPLVMGVVNVTPDSFSDGGRFKSVADAVDFAVALVEQGADLLDVGGESTRPGAQGVDRAEELRRVVPVIQALVARVQVPVSIDTSKPEVMRAAVAAGAGMINDVTALRTEGALEAAAQLAVPVILMHMLGEPRSMQDDPQYADVVADVHRFLADRLLACQFAGIERNRLLVDPGFGFGKTLEHNLALLRNLQKFSSLGVPLVVGMSRKSMLTTITGRQAAADRIHASVAAALLAVERGAQIVRVHDVAATRDALAVLQALQSGVAPKTPPLADRDAARRARLLEDE